MKRERKKIHEKLIVGIIDYLFLECFISQRYCLDSIVEVSGKKKVIPSHKTGNEICICNERMERKAVLCLDEKSFMIQILMLHDT